MNLMSQFVIPLKGIKDGIHFFELTIEDRFFESFNKDDISGGKVEVKIEVSKSSILTSIKFFFDGTVNVPCDRCLDNFDMEINSSYEMFVKYSDNEMEDDDRMIFLKPDEHELDIFPYLQELIELSLPLKKVHPDLEDGSSGCNNEMLKHLEKHLAPENKDKNTQWDDLKKFFNN